MGLCLSLKSCTTKLGERVARSRRSEEGVNKAEDEDEEDEEGDDGDEEEEEGAGIHSTNYTYKKQDRTWKKKCKLKANRQPEPASHTCSIRN